MQITDRDVLLFRLVDGHRLIDSRQLQAALLGDGNERHFLERLKELFNSEYLARPRSQKRPGEVRRHMVYALGIRGRERLDKLDQIERDGKRDWRLENSRLKLDFLEHEIAVTETVLALHIAAEERGWRFRFWRDPRYHSDGTLPVRVPIDAVHGRFDPLPLRPDAYIEMPRGDGHQVNLFVEVDRGTEPQVQTNFKRAGIAQKMLAYWNHIAAAKRAHGTRAQSWRVLFVTTSAARAANMRRVAQDHVDPKRFGTPTFLVTTLDRCAIDLEQPRRVFDDFLWWSTKIGYENPRQLFLDACPKCHQLVDPANEPHEVLTTAGHRLLLAPASSPLSDLVPDVPVYAHTACPGR